MDEKAMAPFGEALKAYWLGDRTAEVLVCRDDGMKAPLPAGHFFRESSALTPIECEALDRCRGRILDVGAGAGIHSLELQRQGIPVAALDICPQAVEIMKRRGVNEVFCGEILHFESRRFDTLLLLGHGIGMMETLDGLDQFLGRARTLVSDGGQILLDSMDPAITQDPQNLAYHAANRAAGRYIGEVRMCFAFGDLVGPYFGWLHVDPETLSKHAATAGWSHSILHQEESGEYLAQLTTKEH